MPIIWKTIIQIKIMQMAINEMNNTWMTIIWMTSIWMKIISMTIIWMTIIETTLTRMPTKKIEINAMTIMEITITRKTLSKTVMNCGTQQKRVSNPQYFIQGILKREVSLYCWPPVWLVWNQLYDNWQFLFLFVKQTNPNQSNRRSTVQWYFPLKYSLLYSA